MNTRALFFTAPGQVEVREQKLPAPGVNQVLVQTLVSAISTGTELLLYRGQFPQEMEVDQNIPALAGEFHYPLKYGYSTVGRVVETGAGVDSGWQGKLVFAFNPHESAFLTSVDTLQPVPEDIAPEEAVFLPNMETALNLVMDGRPVIGERVVVLGQGVVGLLTTALLAYFPLGDLVTLERYALRRRASLDFGAHASLDPDAAGSVQTLQARLPGGSDLSFELSGSPQALDHAIDLTGFDGRVIIGSWYGQKRADLNLGGRFHRSRIRLVSSQVSTIAPELSGRWDRTRRFAVAWEMVRKVRPGRLISRRLEIGDAASAYRLLDQQPGEAIQILFTYP